MRLGTFALSAVVAAAPAGLLAQGSDALYTRLSGLSGFEYRGYSFDPGISVKSVSQWNLPLIVLAPLGRRMSVDVTTHLVSGRITSYAGTAEKPTGPGHTQPRLLYTVSRHRLGPARPLTLPT